MSGPWLYSAVDQAWASETKPIQKIGIEPANSSVNQKSPAGLTGRARIPGPECSVTDMRSLFPYHHLARGCGPPVSYLILAKTQSQSDSKAARKRCMQGGSTVFPACVAGVRFRTRIMDAARTPAPKSGRPGSRWRGRHCP